MKLFLSGVGGAILGLICLLYWWGAIITIIKAGITVFLLSASALALFLGYEEIQTNIKAEQLAKQAQQEKTDAAD